MEKLSMTLHLFAEITKLKKKNLCETINSNQVQPKVRQYLAQSNNEIDTCKIRMNSEMPDAD